jgi:serine/threonine protein phosphatase PrpC
MNKKGEIMTWLGPKGEARPSTPTQFREPGMGDSKVKVIAGTTKSSRIALSTLEKINTYVKTHKVATAFAWTVALPLNLILKGVLALSKRPYLNKGGIEINRDIVEGKVEVATSQGCGGKKNEDTYSMGQIVLCGTNVSFALVADGHGGSEAAQFLADEFAQYFQVNFEDQSEFSEEAVKEVAAKVLPGLKKKIEERFGQQGATLALNMIYRGAGGKQHVISLQVGDARTDILRRDGRVESHKGPSILDYMEKAHPKVATWLKSPLLNQKLKTAIAFQDLNAAIETLKHEELQVAKENALKALEALKSLGLGQSLNTMRQLVEEGKYSEIDLAGIEESFISIDQLTFREESTGKFKFTIKSSKGDYTFSAFETDRGFTAPLDLRFRPDGFKSGLETPDIGCFGGDENFSVKEFIMEEGDRLFISSDFLTDHLDALCMEQVLKKKLINADKVLSDPNFFVHKVLGIIKRKITKTEWMVTVKLNDVEVEYLLKMGKEGWKASGFKPVKMFGKWKVDKNRLPLARQYFAGQLDRATRQKYKTEILERARGNVARCLADAAKYSTDNETMIELPF